MTLVGENIRVTLTDRELLVVADHHLREAEMLENDIDTYGPGYEKQKTEWADEAGRHRARAEALDDRRRLHHVG